MKKSFRKTIAVLLAVLMVVCTLPITALADDSAKRPNINLQFGTFYSNEGSSTATDHQKYVSTGRSFSPSWYDNSGLNTAKLDYDKNTGTLSEASSSHTYAKGDFFTVTVLLENVSKLASTQIAVKYSDNITPAGVSSGTYKGAYSGTLPGTATTYVPGEAITAQSGNALYNTTSTVGELSYVDDTNNIMWADFAVQDGNDYIDLSSEKTVGVNTYTNTAVLATFAFEITDDGAINFALASSTDTEDAFYLASTENGGSTSEYVTYAETKESGSTGMDFMGKNEYVATTKYTITFKNADGTVISTTEYDEGETVVVPDLPSKAPDANKHYTYAWDKTPSATAVEDATYTVVETAADHDYDYTVVTEPTYTEEGLGRYTCKECSYSYDEAIPVKTCTHDWVVTGETVIKEATCTEAGSKEVSSKCSICEATKTETVAIEALGHSWGAYTYNGDASYTSSTDYVDGTATRVCSVCKEKDTKTIEGTAKLRCTGYALALEASLTIQFNMKKANIQASLPVTKVVITRNGKETVFTEPSAESTTNNTYNFSGITPQAMGDDCSAVVYSTTSDGIEVWGPAYTKSVLSYTTSQLAKYTDDKSPTAKQKVLRTLLVDMLYYGASVQTKTGYKSDQLVTALLDEYPVYKTWASTPITTFNSVKNWHAITVENATARWNNGSLSLESAVTPKLKFSLKDGQCDIKDVVMKATVNGTTYEYNINDNPENFEYSGQSTTTTYGLENQYYFYFTNLNANNMCATITVQPFVNGVAVGDACTYSAESYVSSSYAKATAVDQNMYSRIITYGVSANNYKNA